jgi:hypothetical protein
LDEVLDGIDDLMGLLDYCVRAWRGVVVPS